MKTNELISVIVPVYNAEKYLHKCIRSVLNQDYPYFELILVNDGSTDNSLSIMEQYNKTYERVIVIDKKHNEGTEVARHITGYQQSRGKYVMFLDSDDWIEPDCLSSMINCAEETGADVVYTNYYRVLGHFIKQKRPSPVKGYICQPELFDKYFMSFMGNSILPVCLWAKLFKRVVVDNINYQASNLKYVDDLYFNMILFPNLRSIYILDLYGYNYRALIGMTSSVKFNANFLNEHAFLYHKKKQMIEKYNYYKAFSSIISEILDCFYWHIYSFIVGKAGTKEELFDSLPVILKEPCFDDVRAYYKDHNDWKDTFKNKKEFIDALQNDDIQTMVKIAERNSSNIKTKLRNIALAVLSKI